MNKNPAGTFYRHIVKDAWTTLRANRVLWIFGFFVAFLGNGGIYELLIQGTGRLGLRQDFGGLAVLVGILPSGPELLRGLESIGAAAAAKGLFMALALLGVFVLALWAVVSSQGALMIGIREAARGKKIAFTGLFNAGSELFWPLLWLNLLARAAVTAFFYLLLSLLVLLLADGTLGNALLYLLAFLIVIPLTIIIGFVTIYTAGYITLYRMRFVEAAETALALFRTYWLISLETALLLFIINIAVAVGLAMAMIALAAVFFVAFGIAAAASSAAAWIFLALAAAAALVLVVGAGAGLAAFQYAVWTEVFLKLNQRGHGAVSKLARLFDHLLRK